MTMQIIRGESPSLLVEVTVNGSKSPVVVVRHREGGLTLDATTVALFDTEKREAWINRMVGAHGEACGSELRAMVVDLAAEVATALASKPGAPGGQGQVLMFPEPEPWPKPVDLGALLDNTVKFINRFTVMPDGAAETVALWVGLTYNVEHTDVFPKLALLSPTPRCGKTVTLRVVHGLGYRAETVSNITPAAVFRVIEAYSPTLLIDEADQFLATQPELVGLINAGHSRDSASIIRNVGDDHEPRRFSLYGPQAIAAIGRLPTPALADRSIVVQMQRKPSAVEVEPIESHSFPALCAPLRGRFARWARDHGAELREANPGRCPGLHDRAQDNWRGLFALADLAGPEWAKRTRSIAQALTGEADTDDTKETLLADLYDLFAADPTRDRLSTENEILPRLVKMDDRPYSEWGRLRKHMTPVGLASILKPFKVRPKQMRDALGENVRGYLRADFVPVWSRYGIPPATPATCKESQQLTASQTRYKSEPCSGSEEPVSPCPTSVVAGVAGQKPPVAETGGPNGSAEEMVRLLV